MEEIKNVDFIKTDKIYSYKKRALNRAKDHIHYKTDWVIGNGILVKRIN